MNFFIQLARLYQMVQGLGTKLDKDALLEKFNNPVLNSVYIEEWSALAKCFLKALPFSLTPSQLSAVSEIIWDLKRTVPMNRLLQVVIYIVLGYDCVLFFLVVGLAILLDYISLSDFKVFVNFLRVS